MIFPTSEHLLTFDVTVKSKKTHCPPSQSIVSSSSRAPCSESTYTLVARDRAYHYWSTHVAAGSLEGCKSDRERANFQIQT